jgi:hypothetical protein
MKSIKQGLFRLFAIFAVAILPLFGTGMAGCEDAPEKVAEESEVPTSAEYQVNSSGVRVGVYRGRYYYNRPYYDNYPRRSYNRLYHAPRARYPRYNYRYYYYENYRPYGSAYYGS